MVKTETFNLEGDRQNSCDFVPPTILLFVKKKPSHICKKNPEQTTAHLAFGCIYIGCFR